jgi:hypothetical protein
MYKNRARKGGAFEALGLKARLPGLVQAVSAKTSECSGCSVRSPISS